MSAADRALNILPEWMRSARFRIAILYSVVLFVIAVILLGTVYFALLKNLQSHDYEYRRFPVQVDLDGDGVTDRIASLPLPDFEDEVNKHALDQLREFSFGALGVLFVVSLGVGWVISGRVLSPIDRITGVANEIQATDLSRRIRLGGPADELKRLADTFDGMLARLDQAFAAQRRFIADASHELRNPLAVVRTNVDVVLADPDASREDLLHAAIVVQRATDRMKRLVDDLLALARLESPDDTREEVDLRLVSIEVSEELAALAAEHDVELRRMGTESAPTWGDPDALKRVVTNLVDNAIRFGPRGTAVTLEAGARGSWSWLAVRDRGPGIAPEHHDRVFERFWRVDKSRTREHGGSGLGLAIVRQIIEQHDGSVRLFSEPGAGSTFVIWVPSEEGGGKAAGPPPLEVLPAGEGPADRSGQPSRA